MCIKFRIIVMLCYSFEAIQAWHEDITTPSKLIARQYLSINDVIEVSIVNLQIAEKSPPPLMMVSFMVDKTLGYDIDPFFPYLKKKLPVLDLDAAAKNQNFIASPSTIVYNIDFTNETLVFSSSSARNNSNCNNLTEMKWKSSKKDGIFFHNLSFVFVIDSEESSGLHTLFLHSNSKEDIQMKVNVEVSKHWKILSVIWSVLFFGVYCFAVFSLKLHKVIKDPWILFIKFYIFLTYPIINLAFDRTASEGITVANAQPLNGSERSQLLYYLGTCLIGSIDTLILATFAVINYWNFTRIDSNFNWTLNKVFHLLLWLIMTIHFILYFSTTYLMEEHFVMFMNLLLIFSLTLPLDITFDEEWEYFLEPQYFRTRCRHGFYTMIVLYFFAFSKLILATMVFLGVPFYLFWIEIIIKETTYFMLWRVITSIHVDYLVYRFNPPGDMVAGA